MDIALPPCVIEDPSLPKSVDITHSPCISKDFDPSLAKSVDITLPPCVSKDFPLSLPKSVDITLLSSVSEDMDTALPKLEDCENAEDDVLQVVEKVSFEPL